MVGLEAPGVRQLRHAEQVDLVRHDQGADARPRASAHAASSGGAGIADAPWS